MAITRKAFLTGITGQDGSYLAEFLLGKGYEVHGIIRRSSTFNTSRIDHLYHDPHINGVKLFLHYGDLNDSVNLVKLLYQIMPDEIYHLGAQSHVRVSFDIPEYTGDVTGLSTVRLLEAIRETGIDARFYQASSSEMYGAAKEVPQNENTRFHPRSPYACAKVYSFHTTINYRESYDVFACNGILFNHESPRRGETFVTRKITRAAGRIKLGLQKKLYLGTLDAKRDWGYAPDYVDAMWRMLQQDAPDDYVVATGESHSVGEFLELAFSKLDLDWHDFVETDPRYFRPAEVDHLEGDYSRANKNLGWSPTVSFDGIVERMVASDHELAEKEAVLACKSVVQSKDGSADETRQTNRTARNRNKNQIVFVADRAQMRLYRQAWALKRKYPEQELVLAAREVEEPFFKPVFDNIYVYKNKADLASFVSGNHPLVYHTHEETNTGPALVAEKSDVPVIYDTPGLTGLRFGIEDLARDEREKEKYALEHCDAFVLRFESSVLDYYRDHGYKIDAPALLYRDYCVSDFCDTELPAFDLPHLVYAGVLSPSRFPKTRHGHYQLIEIAKEIIAQKVHFHLYIDRRQMEENSEYKDYIDLGRKSQYLHFGYSSPQVELQRTISRLHYGCMLNPKASSHLQLFREHQLETNIATYFEAGLPILVSSHFSEAAGMLKELNAAVEIPVDEISGLCRYLSETDYMSLWKNVLRLREAEFSALEKVNTLMEFYRKL